MADELLDSLAGLGYDIVQEGCQTSLIDEDVNEGAILLRAGKSSILMSDANKRITIETPGASIIIEPDSLTINCTTLNLTSGRTVTCQSELLYVDAGEEALFEAEAYLHFACAGESYIEGNTVNLGSKEIHYTGKKIQLPGM